MQRRRPRKFPSSSSEGANSPPHLPSYRPAEPSRAEIAPAKNGTCTNVTPAVCMKNTAAECRVASLQR